MRTYVLACNELPERRDAALAHVISRGVTPRLWPGIHGKSWALQTTAEYDPGKRISPGHVGLLLGHWSLWSHLRLEAIESARRGTISGAAVEEACWLVLEDDVVLPPTWKVELAGVLADLARHMPDWQFVFVGLAENEPHVWHKVTERIGPPDSRLCRLNLPFGTHAYLVRASALPILMEHFPKGGAYLNMDLQLYRNVLGPGLLQWCAVLPTLIRQKTFDYVGTGTPEWGPSTIDPDEIPGPRLGAMREQDAQRLAGRDVPPERVSMAVMDATLRAVDPFPCFYKGEALDEHGRSPSARRSIPVFECARLGTPCHTKPVDQVAEVIASGNPVTACETCTLRTSIAAASAARPRLPVPEGHFNPSVIQWMNRTILATRDSWGHSKVALWDMTNSKPDLTGTWSVKPIGSFASEHKDAPRLEDPRLFVAKDPDTGYERLHAMFNLPDAYPPKRVQVGYVRFNGNLTGIEHTEVFRSPAGNAYEKNWVPFFDPHDNEIKWVYAGMPDHVVLGRQNWKTANDFGWSGGVWRGGASPVRIEREHGRAEYYHFFHGCLKRFTGSVYSVGCAVFEANAPYRILRQTPVPLIWPEPAGPGEDVVKSHVVWPGGAFLAAGAWHLAVGIDDTHCLMKSIPYDVVEAALTDVPGGDSTMSLRDTPLALGTQARPFV